MVTSRHRLYTQLFVLLRSCIACAASFAAEVLYVRPLRTIAKACVTAALELQQDIVPIVHKLYSTVHSLPKS